MPGRAITFDFHDTLVHCDAWFELEVRHFPSAFLSWHNENVHALAEESVGVELDAAYRKLRLEIIEHGNELSAEASIALIYEQAGLQVDRDAIAAGVDALMRGALQNATAVDGAVVTVKELAQSGVPLGVISSAVHHPFLEWALESLGMRDSFQLVVTSASSGYYKSRPEIYLGTLEQLHADPAESIHIGDSARFDVEGAGRAGMLTVWLKRGSTTVPTHPPTLVINSLVGAAPAILNLWNGA